MWKKWYKKGFCSSPFTNARFGAIALGQQTGIWLVFQLSNKCSVLLRTSDTRQLLSAIVDKKGQQNEY